MAYTTFRNEKVLVQSDGCTLVECDAAHRPGRQYVAITANGMRTDYPHWDGVNAVRWDDPEWFPISFREKAGRVIFDARNEYEAFNDQAGRDGGRLGTVHNQVHPALASDTWDMPLHSNCHPERSRRICGHSRATTAGILSLPLSVSDEERTGLRDARTPDVAIADTDAVPNVDPVVQAP
jgi:hypothetical protein